MKSAYRYFREQAEEIKSSGLWKDERIITTPQNAYIDTTSHKQVLNMCANNYLGLSNHSKLIEAAKQSYDKYGYGLSSVRFICGTQTIHKELEHKISSFLETDDTILYSSCFDANTGLLETLLGPEDAIISDQLNHASIIDGVRLCKAKRFVYRNNDMDDLEAKLKEASSYRIRMIATDGVFSMDGIVANLAAICDLAEQYDALVMVDDSHATGFMGKHGKGTHEYCGVIGRVDILTGTLGKALGGASGGYTSGRQEIINLLRQRSRPYLFSNTLAPAIAASACVVFDLLTGSTEFRDRLHANTSFFRGRLKAEGFDIIAGEHPIVPIMLYDAVLAQEMARRALEQGVYVIGFFYPVVPQGLARIRTQVSAAHTQADLEYAVNTFVKVRNDMAAEGLWPAAK
ncbi:MAG: glycine C-acetyltransferase [Firmicutes bacterium]|jgi:glycine C-acetyltransferase|nr:glycine C-acetyltransferase [Bacillota bacterium]NLL88280.1 glycine C-acetyltransferase [Bacillota bacterium]HKM18060.1 glycine C-acetyltransferase [Limnochordia bacterium]